MDGRGGTTLLEMVAGLAVASVIAGTSVAQLPPLVRRGRLAGAAYEVAARLRLARGEALAGGSAITVALDAATRRLVVWRGTMRLATQTLPPDVAFASLPAARRVVFEATGTTQNATITLASGSARRDVVVNQRGRVQVR